MQNSRRKPVMPAKAGTQKNRSRHWIPTLCPAKPGMRSCIAGLICAVLLGLPANALAHRIHVFAWEEGDTVHTQSSANRGKPVTNGEIRVYNATGDMLITGNTDGKGKFSFPRPASGMLRIELLAGPGHKGTWILEAPGDGKEEAGHSHPAVEKIPPVETSHKTTGAAGLSAAEVREIVDEAVGRLVSPLTEQVAALNAPQAGFRDVFGGLGYILGLMGVGAYVHYRRKAAELEGRD